MEKKPKAGKKLPKKAASSDKEMKCAKKSIKTYKIYIFKVLKQVHPDIGISSKAQYFWGVCKVQEEADDYILGNSDRWETCASWWAS